MPTYEYECFKCNHRFEVIQRMTEEPLKRCPKCKCKVRRLIGLGGGVIYKGSGFYTTEYRSDHYKQREKEESGGTSAPPPASAPAPAAATSGHSHASGGSCSCCKKSTCSTCKK